MSTPQPYNGPDAVGRVVSIRALSPAPWVLARAR